MTSLYRLSELRHSDAFVVVRSVPSEPGVDLLRLDTAAPNLPLAACESVVMGPCQSPSTDSVAEH